MKLLRLFFYMTATGLLYLGEPLLGWGLGDLAGYFCNTPRLGIMEWEAYCQHSWRLIPHLHGL